MLWGLQLNGLKTALTLSFHFESCFCYISEFLQNMANQKITFGRCRGKTFEEAYRTDRKFCESLLNSTICDKYPRAFKEYVKSKMTSEIDERFVSRFVDRWNEAIRSEFAALIGPLEMTKTSIHDRSQSETNGDIGVFYRMFVRKCISNLKNENARPWYVEKYAAVFPFKLNRDVPQATIPVAALFDEQFYERVGEFTRLHFGNVNVSELVDLLLRNVFQFRRLNFSQDQFRRLREMCDCKFAGQSFKSGDRPPRPVNKYLKMFPRLNYSGCRRYERFCQIYCEIFKAYHEREPEPVSELSWRCLPEINCFELLRLLQTDFFKSEREEYEKTFLKYWFFFNNAINSEEKPVFFVDRLLFECMQHYVEYRSSRVNPQEMQFVVWMMALVHRRRQNLDPIGRQYNRVPQETDMNNMQAYVESYPEVESASLDLVIETKLINSQIFLCTGTTLFRPCFSRRERDKIADFAELFIEAATCPRDIKHLVIYNGFTGTEIKVVMPSVKNEILNFVGRYNKCDTSIDLPAEWFITSNLEQYFDKDTIDWYGKTEYHGREPELKQDVLSLRRHKPESQERNPIRSELENSESELPELKKDESEIKKHEANASGSKKDEQDKSALKADECELQKNEPELKTTESELAKGDSGSKMKESDFNKDASGPKKDERKNISELKVEEHELKMDELQPEKGGLKGDVPELKNVLEFKFTKFQSTKVDFGSKKNEFDFGKSDARKSRNDEQQSSGQKTEELELKMDELQLEERGLKDDDSELKKTGTEF